MVLYHAIVYFVSDELTPAWVIFPLSPIKVATGNNMSLLICLSTIIQWLATGNHYSRYISWQFVDLKKDAQIFLGILFPSILSGYLA
jgi:hypothetical protein